MSHFPPLKFQYEDAGMSNSVNKRPKIHSADRAVALALGITYDEAFELINKISVAFGSQIKPKSHAMSTTVIDAIMLNRGWKKQTTYFTKGQSPCHLNKVNFPLKGEYIAIISCDYTYVKDGIIYDIEDPSRGGARQVYGYYYKP